jgi:glutathione S-transferase
MEALVMAWVELITLLALIQLVYFSLLVGRARGRYGIHAPATTGNEHFERYYRVQVNTIETLILFLPALWIAAKYWSPKWVSIIGAVYLVGRMLYLRAYVREPKQRSLGYGLSALPVLVLIVAGLAGIVRALLITGGS